MQGAVRAVIAQRRLQLLVAQIQAGKLEPKSLIQTQDNGIRWALWHPCSMVLAEACGAAD